MTGRRSQQGDGTAEEQAPAAEARSLDEQIEETRKVNELLKLEVERRKLTAVLGDLDDKARVKNL